MSEPHFAVASTFSPRFRAVLAEADRVARKFDARLSVLHADERSDEKVGKFLEAFGELGREEVDIYWCEGATAGEALVDAAASEYFDLVIVGAIDPNKELRNFTGSVVKDLLHRAPCDLLLLPNPQEHVTVTEESACLLIEAHRPRWHAARDALAALVPSRISVIAAENPFAQARDAALGHKMDDSTLEGMCAELEQIAPGVDFRTVHSNTGFSLCDIIQHDPPDYLIVEAEWRNRCRHIPPHLDWLTQVIPARLFLLGKPPFDEGPKGD